MPVVLFPGVKKRFDEWTPEELEENFNRIVATLPQLSDEESAMIHERWWEETYCEHFEEAVGNFSDLLREWTRTTGDTFGTDSDEYRDLQQQIEPVKAMLYKIERNYLHPEVKKIVKPLSAIWAEYRGGYYNDEGTFIHHRKPLGPEIISAFWRTASLDL